MHLCVCVLDLEEEVIIMITAIAIIVYFMWDTVLGHFKHIISCTSRRKWNVSWCQVNSDLSLNPSSAAYQVLGLGHVI